MWTINAFRTDVILYTMKKRIPSQAKIINFKKLKKSHKLQKNKLIKKGSTDHGTSF